MKFALIFLLVCASAFGCQRNFVEDKIKKFIYALAEKLRNEGIPELNITSLDPWLLENVNLAIKESAMVAMQLNVSTAKVTGLTYFDITNLTFSLTGMKFTYEFKWREVNADGKYTLNGRLGALPVLGNGTMT